MRDRAASQEVLTVDDVRPRMARAELADTPSHTTLRRVIDLVLRRRGNIKASAGDMQIDRAQLYRQVENGHLTVEKLEALDAAFFADLGRELLERYGPLVSPKARARQKVREIKSALDEVEQALDLIAS